MARSRGIDDDPFGLKRYKHIARRYKTTAMRRRWRTSAQSLSRPKPTPAQLAVSKVRRAARKLQLNEALEKARDQLRALAEDLHAQFGGHDVKYYLRLITQTMRAELKKRKTSRWIAYLRSEVKRINEDAPAGQKKKVFELSAQVSSQWRQMSKEEQVTATDSLLHKVAELRTMKRLSVHNVPKEAFGDATHSLSVIEDEMRALHARTGTETILIAVRGDLNDYLRPLAMFSSERGPNFFRLATGMELTTFAIRFEAYSIAGVDGVARNYVQDLLQLKSETAALIAAKLQEVAKSKIRMIYKDFDKAITLKYGVVVDRWPLPRFCAPSDLACRNEVSILREAFMSNKTQFRQLTNREWQSWLEQRDKVLSTESSEDQTSPTSSTSPTPPMPVPPTPEQPASSSSPVPEPQPPLVQSSANGSDPTATDHRPTKRPRHVNFVNAGVTDVNGNATFITQQKVRKARSDKGKKRGPRKNKENDAAPAT